MWADHEIGWEVMGNLVNGVFSVWAVVLFVQKVIKVEVERVSVCETYPLCR